MANYICIDGGTTNTRLTLVCDGKIVDYLKYHVGAKKGIDDKNLLKDAVTEGISTLLSRNTVSSCEITRVLASGMITSEFGLVNLPHITAPAGLSELHRSMYETKLDDVSNIPFAFIRGVKTDCKSLESADMMRGEETELAALFKGEGIYVLSGSHSKIVSVNGRGEITDFKTMLTGEMIAALRENTILKSTVEIEDSELNEEYLLKGYDYARSHGINEALFKVRILKNIFDIKADEIYSFYLGVVLCDEVSYILLQTPKKVVLTGQTNIKDAIASLVSQNFSTAVEVIPETVSDSAAAMGMIKIFEHSDIG